MTFTESWKRHNSASWYLSKGKFLVVVFSERRWADGRLLYRRSQGVHLHPRAVRKIFFDVIYRENL